MSGIAIVTDSACDMPVALQREFGITTIPLTVRFGMQECLDCDLALEDFWVRALQSPPYPGTSQPSVGQFEQEYARHVEQGKHVICLTVTSKHSGTYNSAGTAAQQFPGQVTVFDTHSLSLAQGYMAIRAAEAAARGENVEQVMRLLESLRERTKFFVMLDTIEFLRRGGRADRIMPVLEKIVRMLSIKPILHFVDGELAALGAARSRDKATQRILQEIVKLAPAEKLIVLHTRAPDAAASLAAAIATEVGYPMDQVMIGEAGPVLSCHAGPGVLAAAIVQVRA